MMFNDLKCYYGYHSDDATLVTTASGGLATALSQKVIADGGVVFGVVYSEDFDGAEYERADTAQQLERFKGSKYVDVKLKCNKRNVIDVIIDDLSIGKTVLFFGFPCLVSSVKKRIEKEEICQGKFIAVELFCHGPVDGIVAKEYAKMMENKYKQKVTDLTVKYKKNGQWTPPYLKTTFENGKSVMKPFVATEYGFAFRVAGLNRCYSCKYKKGGHYCDLSIGDYWGCNSKDEGYNSHGVSVAVAYTENGASLIEGLENFKLFDISYEDAIKGNPYYENVKIKDVRSDRFIEALKNKGLKAACKECMSFKEKLRCHIPQGLINLIHKIK